MGTMIKFFKAMLLVYGILIFVVACGIANMGVKVLRILKK